VALRGLFGGVRGQGAHVSVHTWLPDAHTEAPTAGSVILAGILLKMGGYGLLRIALPILPALSDSSSNRCSCFPRWLLSTARTSLWPRPMSNGSSRTRASATWLRDFGNLHAQPEWSRGRDTPDGQPRIVTGALFLCVGMIYERTHTREIVDYGGLAKVAPIYSTFLALFCLAAAGFPGLNSFVGEFLVISGAFKVWPWVGAMAIWGVALGTAYLLWLYYRVALGELRSGLRGLLHLISTPGKWRPWRPWRSWS